MQLSGILKTRAYTFKRSIGFFIILAVIALINTEISLGYELNTQERLENKQITVIRGIVREKSDSDKYGSIAGARIKLIGVRNQHICTVKSNKRGNYEIKVKILAGKYKIICYAEKFKQETMRVEIRRGEIYKEGFDFYLEAIDSDTKLIGPQGGEITSADSKIKINIPVGALTDPAQIGILRIDKELLSEAAPVGSTLLNVVECKPYGQVFNKPVELTYSLDYAVIPGTEIELGLYDSIQDKIVSTGQTAAVSIDGYTVKFWLMHFSTYACLEYASKQGAPIGAGVQIPLPDLLTGSFSYAVPINVAPGRKGIQPRIGLSYRSTNSNSWVGLGFSLNSGYIVRSTRLGPPKYDDKQDTFYFITASGTTELVNLIDNLYQAKIESGFTKFFKESDDSWKAVSKDGGIIRFGQFEDAKETNNSGTYSWYITKAIDTNGNYIQYNYIKDQGKVYLSRIDYTGNESGIEPSNSVEFKLESREDISSSYISSAKIAQTKRLKEIESKVKGELVWRYELEYEYSPDTNRSLLKTVKQTGNDGSILPRQEFSYQKSE